MTRNLLDQLCKKLTSSRGQLAISSFKSAMADGQVKHPGRYFIGVIKNIYPDLFQEKKQTSRPSQQKKVLTIQGTSCNKEPEVQRNYDLNMSQILNIRRLLDKNINNIIGQRPGHV